MTDAPERIWAWEYAGAKGTEGQWRGSEGACPTKGYTCTPFVRADLATHSDALLERAIRAALERAAERCDPSSYQAHHAANHSRPTSQAAVPHYQEIADLLRTARLEDEARHAARVEREIQFELET